jgi:hypothetical protein
MSPFGGSKKPYVTKSKREPVRIPTGGKSGSALKRVLAMAKSKSIFWTISESEKQENAIKPFALLVKLQRVTQECEISPEFLTC